MDADGRCPQRKTPPHHPPLWAFNRPVIIFITVCTDKKKQILYRADAHALIIQAWRNAGDWLVGRYVIMPDHIHLFCAPARWNSLPLERWVRHWKSGVSRKWARPGEKPFWQRSFWDTQIRSAEKYAEKWEYVRMNPVRAGLVATASEWPFQGELNVLDWRE